MQSFYDQPPLTLGRRPQSATLWLRAIASLIAIDVLSVFGGFGMAIVTRTWLIGGTEWHSLLLTLLPLYVLIAFNNHAYSPDNLERPLRAARRGLQAMGVAIVATVLLSFSFKASDNLPRIVAIFGFVLTSTLMFVSRYLFVRHFEKIIGGNPFKVIVICDGEIPVALDRYVTIRADQSGFDPDSHDPLMYDRFAKVLQGADRVVIACSVTRRAAWARALKGVSVQSEIIVQELSILAPLGMDFYHDMPTMVV